ncbi:MAG: hypothetical protein FJX48_11850 [Alphaproteobacteria bacterium]|nr:hypothetical protein [Alphaproteobacteria bacterium]
MLKRLLAGAAFSIFLAGAAVGQVLPDILPSPGEGGILPVETILAEVGDAIGGTLTDIDLERKGGVWVYEIEAVLQDGRKTEVIVDARSGRILSRKIERR